MEKTISGYKAFNKDMKCRGFQFKENETYEMDGDPVICQRGFHFCENPLDTLSYYDLCDSEFCEASTPKDANTATHDKDSKVATTKIKIGTKIGLEGFVKTSVDFLLKITNPDYPWSKVDKKYTASGNYSKLAASCWPILLAGYG